MNAPYRNFLHRCRPAWAMVLAVASVVVAWPWLVEPTTRAADAALPTTTSTKVFCTNGASYLTTNAIFRGNVRVFDPQMYLECELLTLYFPTNSTGVIPNAGSGPGVGSIDAIVAETDVLMMMRGATIIGDRAIYSATNDLVRIVGEIVVIETSNGYLYGTNFVFDRRTMQFHSDGPSTLESKPGISLIEGTNSGLPGMPGVNRPRRTGTNRPGPGPAN
jgi:hypothetical protein